MSVPIIAYQGEPGAYSEAAARRWSPSASLLPCPSFDAVFDAIASDTATCGALPIENSVGGSIHRNYDLLLAHDALHIVGEVELPVAHCLVALPGSSIDTLTHVYSHPQALAQCERFLRTLGPVELIASYDTAGSAKLIAERQLHDAAAIASARAAEVFGLTILRAGVQDFADNLTRFLIIARADAAVPGTRDKTSLVFTLPNEPGSLHRALALFARRAIGLSKLESRPLQGTPWHYLFYADVEAGEDTPHCAEALAELRALAERVRVLGSYARTTATTAPPAGSTARPDCC